MPVPSVFYTIPYMNSTNPAYFPVPKLSASVFKWINGVGTAKASEAFKDYIGIPTTFQMMSPKTGIIKTFTCCYEEAIQNECWDGEFSKYASKCGLVAIVWNS